MSQDSERYWHLDRRVPVAIIVTILVQTAGIVWWVATAESRIGTAERDINSLQARVATIDAQVGNNRDAASRIDERLKTVLHLLEKIERKPDNNSHQ